VGGGTPDNLTQGYDRSPFLAPLGQPEGPVWSPDGSSLTFTVGDAGNVLIARAAVGDGTVRAVIGGERQITLASMRPAAGRIAFIASDPLTPADVYVANWDGSGERRLTNVNRDLLDGLTMPVVERRSFHGPNGVDIDGWLMRPVGATGPAPLLVQIHGGPHGFAGNVFRGTAFYEYALACRGWAVLALNPSGSGSYGKVFMQSLRGRWGEFDLPEQHAAIDALVGEGLVDGDRLAVTGYSYGGYMTSWVVGHTDRFKAAVIGAPVTNLESFHGTSDIGLWFSTGEMLGDLFSNREVFRRLSPITYVDQVTTPTLILHGEADDRCPIGQGEEFFVGLVAAGKVPAEFVRYPGGSHLFLGNGRPSHRVDYSRRVIDWVEQYTVKAAPAREMAAATGDD
jgi:dipeptidyl aminopeptidase/acylaminoacyl peptidase